LLSGLCNAFEAMMMSARSVCMPMIAGSLAGLCLPVGAQGALRPVYRCPGPPVLYTDAITPPEARAKNCQAIESTPVTVIQSAPRRASAEPAAGGARPRPSPAPAEPSSRPADTRVDPAAQRARDTDSRRILEAELRREEDALAGLKREFGNGEPERRGDERNFAKYQERVAEMRSAIGRKEADVAALKRELAKLPP
jgi:hypothetical protein